MRVAERRRLRSTVAPPTVTYWEQCSEASTGDFWATAVALFSHGREYKCESAERRRLRSTVAPPTVIHWEQCSDAFTGDS